MKIGIVSNLYPPHARGGAELVAARIADALYERGHDVFVLTTQPFEGVRSLFPRIRERHLAAVYRFFPLNLYYLRHDRYVPFPLRALWHVIDLFSLYARYAVRMVIHDEEPDVILTHNLKGIGVATAAEIQRQGVPHIHTLHDVQLSVPSGLLIAGQEEAWVNRSILRKWYEAGVRSQIGTPDLILSPSQFLAEFYNKRGLFKKSRVEILPNPLPRTEDPGRGKRVSKKTQFLFVGQLEEHKGIRALFTALDQLGEDVQLHIAGEGSLSEYVSERARTDKRIHFHGFVSLEHLLKIIHTQDAVLVPSTCYENSPTVIYESYLAGVPVIASNIGGIPELIEDGKTGILIPPADAGALMSAMQEVHQNRDAWWDKTQEIKEIAQQYAIDRYVDQLETYIQDVTKQR